LVVEHSQDAADNLWMLPLSTKCGFASTEEGNATTPEEQRAKRRLVTETAREMWG
jgi:5-methyltetrahydropteroyltriglutamate--homocysteine methyltransferase